MLDLPQISEDVAPHRPLVAAFSAPWPGEIAVWLPDRFEGREGGTYRVLGQVRSASGAKYQDGPVTVWTKGTDYALLEVDGEEFLIMSEDDVLAIVE